MGGNNTVKGFRYRPLPFMTEGVSSSCFVSIQYNRYCYRCVLSPPLVRALRPPASPVLTVHSLPAPLVTQSATSPQQRISDSRTAMISPLKDIVIATVLGIGAGMVWNNFKDGELGRITRYYQWHDAQEALKKNAHADD